MMSCISEVDYFNKRVTPLFCSTSLNMGVPPPLTHKALVPLKNTYMYTGQCNNSQFSESEMTNGQY